MVGDLFRKFAAPGKTKARHNVEVGQISMSPAQKVGYLSALEVFRDLTEEDMGWLDKATTQITCQKGQIIYRPGESGEVLYLLKKGAVDLYRLSSDGKKLIMAHLSEQTFFGEMSILGQGMYEAPRRRPSHRCCVP